MTNKKPAIEEEGTSETIEDVAAQDMTAGT